MILLKYNLLSIPLVEVITSALALYYNSSIWIHLTFIIFLIRILIFIFFVRRILVNDFGLFFIWVGFIYWYFLPCIVNYSFLFKESVSIFEYQPEFYYAYFLLFFTFFLTTLFLAIFKLFNRRIYIPSKRIKKEPFYPILILIFLLPIYPGKIFSNLLNLESLAVRSLLVEEGLLNNKLGTIDKFFSALFNYFTIASGMFFVLFSKFEKKINWYYLLYGILILIIVVILSGTRSYSFFLLSSIMGLFYYYKIRVNKFVLSTSLCLFLYLITTFTYIRSGNETIIDKSVGTEIAMQVLVKDNDFFVELIECVKLAEQRGDFLNENPAILFISQFIPRFIWKNKPTSQITREITLDRWGIDTDEGSGSVLSGILGQFYLGMGIKGLFLFSFINMLLSTILNRLNIFVNSDYNKQRSLLLLTSFAAGYFLSFRFLSHSNFMPFFICYIYILLLKSNRILVRPILSIRI